MSLKEFVSVSVVELALGGFVTDSATPSISFFLLQYDSVSDIGWKIGAQKEYFTCFR